MSAIGSHRNFQHLSKISITLAEVLGRVKVVVADDLAEPGPGSFDKGVVFAGAQVGSSGGAPPGAGVTTASRRNAPGGGRC